MYGKTHTIHSRHQRYTFGFTLVELLVALAVSSLVILMVTMIFAQGIARTRAISEDARLVGQTAHLTETFTHRVRMGSDASATSSTQVVITRADLTTTSFALVGDEIHLDGSSLMPPTVRATDLSFNVIDDTVQMRYTLLTGSGARTLSATTTVALRN